MKQTNLPELLERIELKYIEKAMKQTNQNKAAAAELLGIQRTTLLEKIKRYSSQKKTALQLNNRKIYGIGYDFRMTEALNKLDQLSKAEKVKLLFRYYDKDINTISESMIMKRFDQALKNESKESLLKAMGV